eukprot:1353872-Rhodomonas_salina.2
MEAGTEPAAQLTALPRSAKALRRRAAKSPTTSAASRAGSVRSLNLRRARSGSLSLAGSLSTGGNGNGGSFASAAGVGGAAVSAGGSAPRQPSLAGRRGSSPPGLSLPTTSALSGPA